MYLYIYYKNGFHMVLLFWILFLYTNDLFLSTIVALKAFSAHFWYHFSYLYDYNIPRKYNVLKQFVRFTDTGHLASFIYYFFPAFFPIAFNVHFIITFGHWTGKLLLGMKDMDTATDNTMIMSFQNLFDTLNHSLVLILLTYQMYKDPSLCENRFNHDSTLYTFMWLYSWFCLIYIPWRLITKDCVYSVLEMNDTSKVLYTLPIIGLIHVLLVIANISGRGLCSMI